GTKVVQNIVHGSDSVESATREIAIFFPEGM
ncbi:MAG: nucleoside-diphosphate kinase, partial [Actinobacteria bacterium]|nr:nucleoside-diphosphate kinase [Actinomycetota bacterium]MSW23707.1 nucleoside-diphosphate kinase [Actinomycetota bacterium]MSW67958.1 nucleoside-diphosphate kinase [Actinomycetota bacterium]MSW75713.1 nucleoside-diphosphate kinase [Actinomycetota bacterium]MSZ85540.1 nucleoside-diphosphate kinase [Actinomycetota bacterium]